MLKDPLIELQEKKATPDLPEREVRLRHFAEQSKLIPQAMEALRNLKPDLQDKTLGSKRIGCWARP